MTGETDRLGRCAGEPQLPSDKGAQNFEVPLDLKVPAIAAALAEEATAARSRRLTSLRKDGTPRRRSRREDDSRPMADGGRSWLGFGDLASAANSGTRETVGRQISEKQLCPGRWTGGRNVLDRHYLHPYNRITKRCICVVE